MNLEAVIKFLREKYEPNEEIHIANLGDFKTVVISQKVIEKANIHWK